MQLIHRNLLIGIHDALQETFFEKNKYADKVIERLLKAHKKWGSEDRKVVSEIFYNIIRWKKRLEYYIGEGAKPGNIYKLILAYLLWSKTHYKKFEEFELQLFFHLLFFETLLQVDFLIKKYNK